MSRLPSLATALRHARETVARFPLAILSGLGAVYVMFCIIDGPEAPWHGRLLATFVLGLSLFTAAVTTAERRALSPGRLWMLNLGIAAALLVLYQASLGWTDHLAALRLLQLLLGAHLLTAVAPYIGRQPGAGRGFWQYNRFLFLRYLIASFYGLVLWIGLAVALGAVDKLFGVKVSGEAYGYVAAALAFGFHPWFFLTGVPRDYAALETLEDYPQGLKVFTQFVLIPLVVIYLVILIAYLAKVIVTQAWPSGWIGYLVSSVSLTGVLALLLVHPLRERAGSRWVNGYTRWFFVALLPALVMLLLAIGKRIDQYGLTEPRYFLLVLTIWMLAIAVYFGATGSGNIKLLPLTLCLVTFLTAFGPWGAYSFAERSQIARFNRILAANGLGRDSITRAEKPVSITDRRELSAILRWLGDNRGPQAVGKAVGVPLDSVTAWDRLAQRGSDDRVASGAMLHLGIPYVSRWATGPDSGGFFWANVPGPVTLPIAGFELARSMALPQLGWIGTAVDSVELVRSGSDTILVKRAGAVVATLDLGAAVSQALPKDTLEQRGSGSLSKPVIVDSEGAGFRVRWIIDQLGGRLENGKINLQTASGMLLIGGLGKTP